MFRVSPRKPSLYFHSKRSSTCRTLIIFNGCLHAHMHVHTLTCVCIYIYIYSPIHNFSFKNLFCLFHLPARDYPWILKNKRPEKLRDTLKEVEVCFRTFKNGNRWSGFQTPFNSFNFHQDPTVPVLINALLSGRRFQDRWILVWHTSSVHLKIQSRLTDIGNAYCQLHSLFFVVL